MPCYLRACPERNIPKARKYFRALRWAAAIVAISLPAQAEQLWSVHAFGFKVGELRVDMRETVQTYQGTGQFTTTGLAGILARIRFDVSAEGRVTSQSYQPAQYSGHIDTGKRISKTDLDFTGPVPKKTGGAQTSAVPIPPADLIGALDPMTMMWLSVQDRSAHDLCTQNRTQYDGTRLSRLTLTTRHDETVDKITCSGTYDRLGGYSPEELTEMSTSPASVMYRRSGDIWRAEQIRVRTRHGTATLIRQN